MRFFHKTTEAEVRQIREWNLVGLSSVEIVKRQIILKKKYLTLLFNNKRIDEGLIFYARKIRYRFFIKTGKWPEDVINMSDMDNYY